MSWGFYLDWYSPYGHETHLSEICPLSADSQAERGAPRSRQRFAAVCWSGCKLHEDNNAGDESWGYEYDPETKAQSSQWKTLGSLEAKQRSTKFGARWKWCWQFHSITEASFTKSTHQIVKLLTRNTISKLSIGCVMQCGANGMHHGSEVTGRCTITMPPPSHPNLPRMSWLNIRFHKCYSPPIQWSLPHVNFFYSQRWKCCWRGIGFKTQRR